MSLLNRLGLIALLVIAAFISGFFYGRSKGREATLKNAIEAFQNREVINHETAGLDDVDLCIALGGLPDECAALMRGLAETSQGQ